MRPSRDRTFVQWHGLDEVSARSYSFPLKQSLDRLRRSMVILRPIRQLSGVGGDHLS